MNLKKWKEKIEIFVQHLSEMVDFIENLLLSSNDPNTDTKRDSYPPKLTGQLKYLIKLLEAY